MRRAVVDSATGERNRRYLLWGWDMPRTVRLPAVAGAFYPASAAALHATVARLVDAAPSFTLTHLRALIVPHAGYRYSGPIAATGFKQLQVLPPSCNVALLLGPAHRVWVDGVAVGSFDAMATPLGDVPVDRAIGTWLVARGRPFVRSDEAHRPEHSLEVELPFLQVVMPAVRVVPLLFGDTDPPAVARHLLDLLRSQPDLLLIVSSDLSHYFPYDEAVRRDQTLLEALLAGNIAALAGQQACGRAPILTLMTIAHQLGWQPHLLDYRNSGDTAGDKDAVVGYAAVAYTTPAAM